MDFEPMFNGAGERLSPAQAKEAKARKSTRRPRDAQRQKVYDAENAAFGFSHPERFESIDEARVFIEAVCQSAALRERYPRAVNPPSVKKAHGRRNGACYSPRDIAIEFGEGTLLKWIALHELAHHLVRPNSAAKPPIVPHGREFCECYLILVRAYMGRHAESKLIEQFKAKRVAFKAKRAYTISDAERERRAARARVLRERRDVA